MLRKVLLVIPCLITGFVFSQSTLKVMCYNLLEFPEAHPQNRELILKDIIDTYEPDLFMVCELQDATGGNLILEQSLNDTEGHYASATFVTNQSGSSALQQLLFYRQDKMILEAEEVLQTNVRDINHYTLKLRTANGGTNPIVVEVYVAHLKSSEGGTNQAERLAMVEEFVEDTETLDPNAFVVFAGDFNVYTSTEPAYMELLDPTNTITMADPINTPGSWNNNINFQDVHTQSTRISSGPFGAGAGGGLDDRFDFILISENMLNHPSLHYLTNTYQAYGNNGNCFNLSINDASCGGIFSQELRDNLYNMSDHLPVVMELETEEEIVLASPSFDSKEKPFRLQRTLVYEMLEMDVRGTGAHRFEIYSILGQKVKEFTLISGENRVIDVSYLPNGVYLLKEASQYCPPIKFLKVSI